MKSEINKKLFKTTGCFDLTIIQKNKYKVDQQEYHM